MPGYPGAPGVCNALSGTDYVHGIQLQSGTWTDVAIPLALLRALVFRGGNTAGRPASPVLYEYYFDTTVGFPIFWNGTIWVNAAGVAP